MPIISKRVNAELLPTVPGAPQENVVPGDIPTFGKLLNLLEKEYNTEESRMVSDSNVSDNDIKRWALKFAVLTYYKDLGINPEERIVNNVGEYTMIDKLAPNKKKIYDIWLQVLNRQSNSDGRFNLDFKELDEAVSRGTPRGGAFEKFLDRYREEFMEELWKDHYNKK